VREVEAMKKPGQWWDRSWNVVTGCTPAGAGCDNCWARGMVRRFPALHGGVEIDRSMPPLTRWRPFLTVLCHRDRLDEPERRRKPTIYAVPLLGDLFHDDVPAEFVARVLTVMDAEDRHVFVVLTKRPARAAKWLADYDGAAKPARHILAMASVWDQDSANAACAAFAPLRGVRWGLHCEPLLSAVDMKRTVTQRIGASLPSWIVVGAENGPGARPMRPDWVRSLRDQCALASVPFYLKGLGRGKGRELDGREHNETPW
jgi:protein gp37